MLLLSPLLLNRFALLLGRKHKRKVLMKADDTKTTFHCGVCNNIEVQLNDKEKHCKGWCYDTTRRWLLFIFYIIASVVMMTIN